MYYHCYITAAPLNQSVAFQCHPDQKSQDSQLEVLFTTLKTLEKKF